MPVECEPLSVEMDDGASDSSAESSFSRGNIECANVDQTVTFSECFQFAFLPHSTPSSALGENVEHVWRHTLAFDRHTVSSESSDINDAAESPVPSLRELLYASESSDDGRDDDSLCSCPPLEDTRSALNSSSDISDTRSALNSSSDFSDTPMEDSVWLSLGESCVQCSTLLPRLSLPGFCPVSQLVEARYGGETQPLYEGERRYIDNN
ncbi:hypothetical protein CYLTODRAFT_492479 [Cylindrobasidium torrendii FP15055 ss-10]|uniref:Uncharacterized protein n=1 Tax=Cylindrobasidium torrendii FP15055 ss-10 TaxID=1314674 RepID=A0A0D7B519_9AGAR|nr:hypothetical protein CYLTODRAFT_492479 [Cylindrobasidium torrendii FP15055 ss-10]